jgi:hypothetical protein
MKSDSFNFPRQANPFRGIAALAVLLFASFVAFSVAAVDDALEHALGQAPKDASRYVLFVHTGAGKAPSDPNLTMALNALARGGYLVRATDEYRDIVGGPGVDYFDLDDKPGAENVANTLNAARPGMPALAPRLQKIRNPKGYLGVWLYN